MVHKVLFRDEPYNQSSVEDLLNRTVCLQQRLRALNASYPLVVVHNWPDAAVPELESKFDRLFKIDRPIPAKDDGGTHLNKFFVFNLTDYDRIIYVDSDLLLRSLPDPLMHMPLEAESPLAAVGCDGRSFNAGLLVLTPSAAAVEKLAAFVNDPRHNKILPGMGFHHACTGGFKGDQFWLNGYFDHRWRPLGRRWNHQLDYDYHPVRVESDVNAHFTGHHKPMLHECEDSTTDSTTYHSTYVIDTSSHHLQHEELAAQLALYTQEWKMSAHTLYYWKLKAIRVKLRLSRFSEKDVIVWQNKSGHENGLRLAANVSESIDEGVRSLLTAVMQNGERKMAMHDTLPDPNRNATST